MGKIGVERNSVECFSNLKICIKILPSLTIPIFDNQALVPFMRLVYCLFTTLFVSQLFGQPNQFRFHHYGQDEGLNSPSINVMAEDAYGFIWVGSEDGLYRFDAYNFIPFRRSKTTHTQLPSNSITALHPLADGSLIVGTREGLAFFDARTQQFTNLWIDQEPVYICKIVPREDEEYWIATHNGLHIFDFSNKRIIESFYHDPTNDETISSNGLIDAILDDKGRLWISTYNAGLNHYDPQTKLFTRYQHDPANPQSISSNTLRKLALTKKGELLVGTAQDGLNVLELDSDSGLFRRYNYEEKNPRSLSAISVYSLLVDRNDQVWVGTWSNGLNLFDLETGEAVRYVYDADDIYSVPHNSMKCLMESSSGDIWIGTDNAGIARLSPAEESIVRFTSNAKKENSLKTDYVRSIFEDEEGRVWIGTSQNGLHQYDPQSGQFEFYLTSDDSRRSKSRGNIWSMSEGENDVIWLGTGIGLGKFNKRTGQTIFYEPDESNPNSISTNTVLTVLDDGQGHVWVGTWEGGLNRLDIGSGRFELFLHDPKDPSSISNNTITNLFLDKRGNLWHNAGGLLHLLNPDGQSFTRFDVPSNGIAQDQDGDLWITSNEGLYRFSILERVAERVNLGLPDGMESNLNAIEIDDDGRIWLGSERGVVCYDPSIGQVVGQLDKANGLVGNNISTGVSEFGPKSKNLYFGGIQGLSMIDPDMLLIPYQKPVVRITDFLLYNESVAISDSSQLKQSIYTASNITLNYSDHIFAFEFAALSYSQSKKIRYAYKLDGFDPDWLYTDHLDRKAVYTNVPAGDYTFMVKCTDHHGQWIDEQLVSIQLTMVPPWWNTWWARTLFYVSVVLLVILIIRARFAIVRKQRELLEQQVQERSAEILKQKEELEIQARELAKVNNQKNKLFSIIAHDLKTPVNTLSSLVPMLDPDILNDENLSMIRSNLSERVTMISTAMEDLLAWAKSQLEGEIITKTRVSIAALSAELYQLFQPYAESKGIRLSNHIQEELSILADQNQLHAILRNLISNAIKFTPQGGEVSLSAQATNEWVEIHITDTGVGIPEDKVDGLFEVKSGGTKGTKGEQGVGLGLIVVKEFVDKNDGSIEAKTTAGQGTTFVVKFKLISE